MAKLKGAKRINKIINEFTEKNFGIHAEMGFEFQAFCGDRLINYTFVMTSKSINYFKADAETRFPEVQADIFLWCLMHEIGHCMTDNMWSFEEQAYFDAQKEMLAYIERDCDRYSWYHVLPDEYMATKFAGEYMKAHPKKMAKFWNKLVRDISNDCKKDNLMDD